jgi:DNA-binding GntR family transcriptional regulator
MIENDFHKIHLDSSVVGSPLTKTEFVLETLRTAILLRRLKPGTRITEKSVQDLLKVSSSPVREAFNQLEAEGLMVRRPHAGISITEINVNDAKELYFIQSLLQGTSVQVATNKLKKEDIEEAEKINDEMEKLIGWSTHIDQIRILNYRFHLLVCGMNVYPWLTRLLSSLWIRLPSSTIWSIPKEAKVAIQFHKKILKAIKKRNGTLASELMKKHLERPMKILFK